MNVLNDPWLYVRYSSGDVKQVSVKQAFIDSEKIATIETPTFHGTKVHIYDVPVIRFLSTIVLAAYFKPETNFIAANKYFSLNLMTKGLDIDFILSYLNKFEDRFNLSDDKYPFLQDPRLKSKVNYDNRDLIKYVTNMNLIVQGKDAPIFEHKTINSLQLEDYIPTEVELIYILLYNATLGTSFNADHYPGKSLSAKATMFAVNFGQTLKETIICNCLPLFYSTKEGFYDRPIWELESRDDYKKFDVETLGKNVLICTFFPSLPSYAAIKDNRVVDFVIANCKKADENICIINSDFRDALAEVFCYNDPWAIRERGKDKDKKEITTFKSWHPAIKILNLCIDITKRLPDTIACNLVSSNYQANKYAKTVIYYREYDTMKCNVLSTGKYEIDGNVVEALQNEQNFDKTVQFQSVINDLLYFYGNFKTAGLSVNTISEKKLVLSKFAENYFLTDFITNINKEDIIAESIDILGKKAKEIIKSTDNLANNPFQFADSYKKLCGKINKLKEGVNNE